jgi:phage terminase Nu1 subunit (DNA packaging protein)
MTPDDQALPKGSRNMTIVKAPDTATEKKAPTVQAKKSPSSRKTVQPRKISGKPETKAAWIREQCTKADLSVLMNVSMRTLRDLDSRGKLVRAPKSGLYMTVPTLNACWDHLRLVAAGRVKEAESPLAAERLKTETIERQIREITLKKLKGEVLTLEEVDESWSTFASQVKAVMLTVPGKARTRIPHLTAHDQETLRTMVKDMLVDLAAEVEASVIGGSGKDIIA